MKYFIYVLLGGILFISACNGGDEPEAEETENNDDEETSENNTETTETDTNENDSEDTEASTGSEENTEEENGTETESQTEITESDETTTDTDPETLDTTLEGTEALIPATGTIDFDTRGTDYLDLITEDTFTNEIGYGAYEDYLELTEEYDLRNYTDSGDTGSSPEDIETMMPDGLEKNEADFSDSIHMVVYRYPDEELYNEAAGEPSMMAEISFIFEDDALIFSSITPGFYEVDISNIDTLDTIGQFTFMNEVSGIDPEVFTLSEINHHGYIFQQVMISAAPIDDHPGSVATAAYIIFLGDDVMQMIAYPFMEASQDFPSYSYFVYNMFIENLAALENQM